VPQSPAGDHGHPRQVHAQGGEVGLARAVRHELAVPGGELLDWQKEYNSEVNKIRWMIEQVISHFKNWTIVHADYRRPLKTFETTISAVVGLHFYRTA
jgi:hypothetical protein